MSLGAYFIRVPADDWKPDGYTPPTEDNAKSMQTTADVTAATSIRTPQFWLLWTVLFCNVTAGIGILEQASPMIQDFFPDIDAKEAAGFVGLLSLANMSGRFIWSSTSDVIGRKPIYMGYLGIGAVLYFVLASSGTAGVALFVAVTALIISFYGGGFATVPAYLKDLFGGLQVGAIHGRLLTAWSAAGIAGPLIVNRVADSQKAAGKEGADLYTLSLYIMVGVLVVGFIANLLIRPVAERYHERTEEASRQRPPRSRNPPTSLRRPMTTNGQQKTAATTRSYPRSCSGSSWSAACSTASCRPPRRSPPSSAADVQAVATLRLARPDPNSEDPMSMKYPRLTEPLVRDDGVLRPATWDEALDRAASGFKASVDRHGPDTFGMFSCSKATNEVNFLAQKFTRVAIGTNNIDSCNRT